MKGMIRSTSSSCWVRQAGNLLRRVQAGEWPGLMLSCKHYQGQNRETSTRWDKKLVPLQSLAVALSHAWLCNPLSRTAARQTLQGLLKEGNHFPNLPAKPVTGVTCQLRFPALPMVQWWACPWYSFGINLSELHGFGKIFPVMLSDPLYSEFQRIKSYLLTNLWCDGITKQVN